jgi:hypothetical protein
MGLAAKMKIATLGLLAATVVGCGQPPLPTITVPPSPGGAIDFADLTAVLAATVDDAGRVDPTALAVHLPRLNRQLSGLSGPWPARARSGSARLAWLYNARAAWSLRIVAEGLARTGLRNDRFALPATIDLRRLLGTPFVLDGLSCTLGQIDEQLARYDDYRIPVAAPGATDIAGSMPRAAFAPGAVTASLPERLDRYVAAAERVVIDHDAKRLRVPPTLWRLAPTVCRGYNQRFGSVGASLATALTAAVGPRARDRLAEAQGYELARRPGPAGIVATDPE